MSLDELTRLWQECPCFFGYYLGVRWDRPYDIEVDLS